MTLKEQCEELAALVDGKVVHLSPNVGIVSSPSGDKKLRGPGTRNNWQEHNRHLIEEIRQQQEGGA